MRVDPSGRTSDVQVPEGHTALSGPYHGISEIVARTMRCATIPLMPVLDPIIIDGMEEDRSKVERFPALWSDER